MPTVKTPEERGPLGAWAYESRIALDLSPESVVRLIGKYDPATLRKAEADSKDMGGPLWRALVKLYPHLASEKQVTLAPIPFNGPTAAVAGDQAAVIAAIDRQTAAITDLAKALRVAFATLDAQSQERAEALAQTLARLEDALVPEDMQDEPEHPAAPQPQTNGGRG